MTDSGWPYLINYDYETSVALGVFMPMENIYGIPGRESSFDIQPTEDSEGPYRLFNRDLDPHWAGNKTELYGSIPYVMGHKPKVDSGFAWMNSADTWVEVREMTFAEQKGRFVNFLSEGGAIECFLLGSVKGGPKRVQK